MARLSTCPPLTRDSVIEAYQLVAPHVHRTPVVTCDTLDEQVSIPRSVAERACTRRTPRIRLYFKLENAQRTGSFKVRGAFHAVKRLMLEDRDLIGVLTHSSGLSCLSVRVSVPSTPPRALRPEHSSPLRNSR